MLGLKIDYRNYDVFLDLLEILGEPEPASGKSGLSNTFVVVFTDSEGNRVLAYYNDKDFHETYKWVNGKAELDHMTPVELLKTPDELATA